MTKIGVARGNTTKTPEWCEVADNGLNSTFTNDICFTKIGILRESDDVGGARDLCARMLEKFPPYHSFLALMDKMGTERAPAGSHLGRQARNPAEKLNRYSITSATRLSSLAASGSSRSTWAAYLLYVFAFPMT